MKDNSVRNGGSWSKYQAANPDEFHLREYHEPLNRAFSLESPRPRFSFTNVLDPLSESPAQRKTASMDSVTLLVAVVVIVVVIATGHRSIPILLWWPNVIGIDSHTLGV